MRSTSDRHLAGDGHFLNYSTYDRQRLNVNIVISEKIKVNIKKRIQPKSPPKGLLFRTKSISLINKLGGDPADLVRITTKITKIQSDTKIPANIENRRFPYFAKKEGKRSWTIK